MKSVFRLLKCGLCNRNCYGDGSLMNDNFLHLCVPFHAIVYRGMRAMGLSCRRSGCYCAYSHRDGKPCMKCGHYKPMEMLNA